MSWARLSVNSKAPVNGPDLSPRVPSRRVAWAGLWLPGVIGFLAQGFYASSVEVSTTWLLLPLCAPTGLSAVLLPALAAAVTCLAGMYVAAVSRNGWAWVITAWLAPWVHFLVFSQLPHEFFC